MCETKYTEQNIPENLRLQVVHLHAGNSSRKARHGYPYVTLAKLISRDTERVVSSAKAICSRIENPSRKIGRAIAIGRALKAFTGVNKGDSNFSEAG